MQVMVLFVGSVSRLWAIILATFCMFLAKGVSAEVVYNFGDSSQPARALLHNSPLGPLGGFLSRGSGLPDRSVQESAQLQRTPPILAFLGLVPFLVA